MKLDSGQTILNWEKFEKRQRAEINSKGNKGRRGYAWEMAKYRLAKGLQQKSHSRKNGFT
jgi:hypothetical protein